MDIGGGAKEASGGDVVADGLILPWRAWPGDVHSKDYRCDNSIQVNYLAGRGTVSVYNNFPHSKRHYRPAQPATELLLMSGLR